MGGVDLHPGKAALLGQLRGAREALQHVGDVRFRHGLRHGELPGQRPQLQRNGGWRQGGLAECRGHLPPGVVDLHPRMRAMGPRDPRPAPEAVEVGAVFQDHAVRPGHGTVIHHDVARQDQAGHALGPCPVQAQERLGRRVVRIRHVLFHGRFGQTVGDHRAVGQGKGREELHGDILG